ncbi:hypothetical protein XU18_0238 [Perkinsela sp. CCAP 1560/4]|nr:hypothetical protein XU18_0238 [Perkinsela sp. CCAP 1560/4]|eukprot:KNH09553.1 hypothetical protein XU18_0238 [Perkinsela sp. CCAP 1560/4]
MYCTFHLLKSATENCGSFDPDFIWNLQKCPTQREYAKKLADFERASPVAANYLGAISPKNWCLWPHVNIHALHGHRTRNYVESCNSLISEIRAMSPLDALDAMASTRFHCTKSSARQPRSGWKGAKFSQNTPNNYMTLSAFCRPIFGSHVERTVWVCFVI